MSPITAIVDASVVVAPAGPAHMLAGTSRQAAVEIKMTIRARIVPPGSRVAGRYAGSLKRAVHELNTPRTDVELHTMRSTSAHDKNEQPNPPPAPSPDGQAI